MSKTIRNIPHHTAFWELLVPNHKAMYLQWSPVRDGKTDRGDGLNRGWRDPLKGDSRRLAKRLASRCARRAGNRQIRDFLSEVS